MELSSEKKTQLHVSMLGTLSACGIQFQRRYGARFGIWDKEEIVPPGIALGIGISTHKSIESNLKNKIDTGALLPRDEIISVARDSFLGIWNAGVTLTDDEAFDVNSTQGAAIDMTIALSELHYTQLAPQLNPDAVEERFVIDLDGYPFDLAGTIDIREKNTIRDTKTSGKRPSGDAIRSMQMAMYSLGFKVQNDGKLPDKIYMDYLLKNKTPKLVILEETPTDAWISPVYRRIERFAIIIDAVRSGKQALTPADPNDWRCSRKWCGYATTCKFWGGKL